MPPAARGWPRTCCLVLLRVRRKPRRCQSFCLHTVPVAQLASAGVMHPEALVLVCTTICSSHFSSVSGAIYWRKTVCRKKPVGFVPMHKALLLRDLHSLCSSSTCSELQGCLLAYKWDLMSCPDCSQISDFLLSFQTVKLLFGEFWALLTHRSC